MSLKLFNTRSHSARRLASLTSLKNAFNKASASWSCPAGGGGNGGGSGKPKFFSSAALGPEPASGFPDIPRVHCSIYLSIYLSISTQAPSSRHSLYSCVSPHRHDLHYLTRTTGQPTPRRGVFGLSLPRLYRHPPSISSSNRTCFGSQIGRHNFCLSQQDQRKTEKRIVYVRLLCGGLHNCKHLTRLA